jgi:hypothetical protein
VIRERIGQAALRAYPPAVRQARGLEMLGMVLDAGEQSNLALVRESGSLVLGGLRARAGVNAQAGSRRLLADSCCQAVLIWLTLWLINALNTQLIVGPSQQLLIQEVTLCTILACALIGYERLAAAGGLATFAAFGPLDLHPQLVGVARAVVPIACLLVMVSAPRKRSRDLRQVLWLLPVCALVLLGPHGELRLPEALALISLGGLLRLLYDPRLAIACSLVWIILLAALARPGQNGQGPLVSVVLMAAWLVLTLAAGRLWVTRHSAAA